MEMAQHPDDQSQADARICSFGSLNRTGAHRLPALACAWVLAVTAAPVLAQTTGLSVCAPLMGTASYSACVNDQQALGRADARATGTLRAVPRPVTRPEYLMTTPDLTDQLQKNPLAAAPFPGGAASSSSQAATDGMATAQRNSDLRSNLLRQQVTRDLSVGPRPPQTLGPMRPVAPMTFP
ncbi:MAG: hypothetical protein AAGF79_17180 [Pseudomonadota bacterium]